MVTKIRDLFTTATIEGALLPPDILQRVTAGDSDLGGLRPEDYHLYGERLNEATNRAWNRLQGAWQAFKQAQERLPEDDLGTTLTRERWLLVLFNALDYGRLDAATAVELDGKSYAISHRYKSVPIHLLSYKVDLDSRTKGVAGAATGSPHSMMQVFLNRTDDYLWGILSNGYRLRILRDNVSLTRQAYIEFDLQAMMEGEVYSDFVLLYLLCHQSRVEADNPHNYWLENWRKAAEEQGKRALEDLRVGVEQAINCLGMGFLDHPHNTALRDALNAGSLDKQDYYRQLLRLVYRLLFLFVAEDRDLLHKPDTTDQQRAIYQHYSTNKLRDLAANLRGTRHHDLYESLRLVMRLLGGTDSPLPRSELGEGSGVRAAYLGLPVLGSFLFSDDAIAHLLDSKIANHDLLEAVRAISTVADNEIRRLRRVDFKNLGSEELGSVYESLLELHPDINLTARTFALKTAGGNERKTTGSYYTPTSLINALLDSALDPVLDEAVSGKSPHPKSFSQGEKDFNVATHAGTEQGLLRRGAKDADLYENIASKAMVLISRDLRKRQTSTEEIMWEVLRDRRLNKLKFRRQHPIAASNYVVDFMCYEAKLVVELDGEIHQHQQEADAKRQAEIEALGYRVIRFTNAEVAADLQWVLATIAHAAQLPASQSSTTGLSAPLGDKSSTTGLPASLGNKSSTTGLPSPLGDKSPTVQLPSPLGRRAGDEGLHGNTRAEIEARILNLKVVDPACGSGHFLIAAANRIAKRLAAIRTGEDEPTLEHVTAAKRDVIANCIYGVDLNEMAVELCKVNLWLESIDPGKPLTFLDSRIQHGNSLLGTTPALMARGIPEDAFPTGSGILEGDDNKVVGSLRNKNRDELKQRAAGVKQRSMFELLEPPTDYARLTRQFQQLAQAPDNTLSAVRTKERLYRALAQDPEYIKGKFLADLWCAIFVWHKAQNAVYSPHPKSFSQGAKDFNAAPQSDSPLPLGEGQGVRANEVPAPPTDLLYRNIEDTPLADKWADIRAYTAYLADQYDFFHWHIAFPEVFHISPHPKSFSQGAKDFNAAPKSDSPLPLGEGSGVRAGQGVRADEQGIQAITGWEGGFDVVLGNPPWEHTEIKEKEWFAERVPDIANAAGAKRKKMISELREKDPQLFAAFALDQRAAEGFSHFVRTSGNYMLTGRGRINTYPLFAEKSRHVINGYGRMGIIVPSGIATDDTTKFFFQDVMQTNSLASFYDFENREGLFPAVDSRMKFCLMTMTGTTAPQTEFVFFAHQVADLDDKQKRFTLTADEIALLNPNTGTMATFRSQKDAEITKQIYYHVPVLVYEKEMLNLWGVEISRMFNLTDDAGLFTTADEVTPTSIRLYEAKLFWQFDHRFSEYIREKDEYSNVFTSYKINPNHKVNTRLFVDKDEIPAKFVQRIRPWNMSYRLITNATNERTLISSITPECGMLNSANNVY
jgi:very-short-patch-repair endonuclease